MSTPAKFRYAFKTVDDTAWYYVENGIVKLSSTPKYFTSDNGEAISPKEWTNTQVGVSRNEKYYGVFTKFAIPMTFTYDAVTILKYIYATDGYEGSVIFTIDKADDLNWTYSELYRCELDLSTISSTDDKEQGITVTASELSLITDLQNKENTTFEIPFDSDALTILNDGIILENSMSWLAGGNTPQVYAVDANDNLFINMAFLGVDQSAYFNNYIYPITQLQHIGNNTFDKRIFLTEILLQCSIDMTFDISITASNSVQAPLELQVILDELVTPIPSNVTHHPLVLIPNFVSANHTNRIQSTVHIGGNVFQAGSVVKFMVAGANNVATSGQHISISINNISLKITSTVRLPNSTSKAFPYLTFLNKLFGLAINAPVLSNYLDTAQDLAKNFDNEAKWTTVTSGDALRAAQSPVIKTTIQEAFKDMRRWGLGLAIEGSYIRIEPLRYFFQKDRVLYTVESCKNVRFYNANDYLANDIKTGYNSVTYDNLNGKEDFFNTNEYYFPTKRINQSLDWVSPYYASPWAIEYARGLGVTQKESTDSQYDNFTYLIDVNSTPQNGQYVPLRRQNIPGHFVNGLDNPESCYNFGLSPANTMYFNAEYLLSIGYGKILNQGLRVTWQTNDKNSSVNRKLDSIYIDESSDILLPGLLTDPLGYPVSPLFQPVIFEIDTVLPENLLDKLKANTEDKYGVVRFPYYYKGVFKGMLDMFILDAVFLPATDGLYTLKGLSSPINNLNIL